MSHQNNYQNSGGFPQQYPQHHNPYQQQQHSQNPHQYGMSNHQQQQSDQNFHQETCIQQQYTYQSFHQNFQQHPPQHQSYAELAKPQQPFQYSQLSQHYASNLNQHQQRPPPPPPPVSLPLPPLPLVQHNQSDPQLQQIVTKTNDPRNPQSNPVSVETSNIASNNSNSSTNALVTEPEASKRRERQLKRQMKKEKKLTFINQAMDSGLALFLQHFTMEEYRKIMHKLAIPVVDRCHGKNKKNKKSKICVSYHCAGSCQHPCPKSESHRPLSASERTRFFDYLSEVKSLILEERNNKEKKTKKKKTKKATREGSAYDENDLYDTNSSVDPVLSQIAKASDLLEYHKRAKKLGISIPRLDRVDRTGSGSKQICPQYHCKGKCSLYCLHKESHRQLSATENKRLADYLLKLHGAMIEERNEDPSERKEFDTEHELQEGDGSTKSAKRKSESIPDSSVGLGDSKKKQRLELDNSDGRFDDCSDDDEVQILETIGATVGGAVVTTPSRDHDGTAMNPVDLTDSLTPMTKELYTGLPNSNSDLNFKTSNSVVVSESSSLDLEQTSDNTTASVLISEDTTTASVPTRSSSDGDNGAAPAIAPKKIPKLSLPVPSSDETTMQSAPSIPVEQTKPAEQPRKEVLSPNSKSRKLKKLKAQLALAKKQHEVAKLKESLRKKDQELKEQRTQEAFRRKITPPVTALTTSLFIDNIHESGPEHMVYYSQDDYDVQLAQYKAILFGDEEEEEAEDTELAKEMLSARKTQIERDLATLKQRLESSLPTTAAAASMSKEDLQKKLEEAQANKDLSYWKLFVSKQEHILSGVDKQIQENENSLKQCTDEMVEIERDSKETLKSIKVLKVREATLAEMAAKSSNKILQLRQKLHEKQSQLTG